MPRSKDESRRRYADEDATRLAFQAGSASYFELTREVVASGPEGDNLRIDAVARCLQTGWHIGLEFKRSHLFKQEFSKALKQAVDYRLSRISDPRLPQLAGQQLPAVALFPDWLGEHDDDVSDYSSEAAGMRLLAAKFRVGTIRETTDGCLTFLMGEQAIWRSEGGWNGNAAGVLFGKRGQGAGRRKDLASVASSAST